MDNNNIILKKKREMVNILENEKIKYRSKGSGFIVACLIAIFYFTIVVSLSNVFYKRLYSYDFNPGKFTFWSVLIVHHFVFTIVNLGFYFIYTGKYKFFEKYRVTNDLWPWEDSSESWSQLFKDTLKILFINQFIVLPLSMTHYYLNITLPFNLDPDQVPNYFEFIWQIIFFMITEDFFFYWGHRFFHLDWIYPYIHKLHHTYKVSISISSEFTHPVEYFFTSIVTTSIGSVILGDRVHLITYLLWISLRICEAIDGHCGYEFSFSPFRIIPCNGSSEFHYFHHKYYKGNYSSFFIIWDRVCNTINKTYIEYYEEKNNLVNKKLK